jgi:hypothetical protein
MRQRISDHAFVNAVIKKVRFTKKLKDDVNFLIFFIIVLAGESVLVTHLLDFNFKHQNTVTQCTDS